MDTKSLRLFVLACETLNISAAGRTLGMAPAVASARLAKLEHALGADLLHRSTRKVSLSLEGANFLPYAREMIAQEEAALAALGKGSTKLTGTLRVAAPSTFAQMYIAPLVPEFMDAHPDLTLDLHLSDTQFDLIEGSFDIALRNAVLADSSLMARKLADDARILCAAPGYLAQYGTPSTPDALRNHRLVAFKSLDVKGLVASDGSKATFDPKEAAHRMIVDDGLAQVQVTLQGAGISLNSKWAIHKELAAGTLERVLPDYKLEAAPSLWLVYPKSNVLSAKARVFMDFLADRIGKHPVWERSP